MAKNKIGLLGLSNTTLLLIGGGIALYLFSIKKTETISGLKKNKLSKKVKEELLEDYIYFIGLGYSKKDSIEFATRKIYKPDLKIQYIDILENLIFKNIDVIEEEKNRYIIRKHRFNL